MLGLAVSGHGLAYDLPFGTLPAGATLVRIDSAGLTLGGCTRTRWASKTSITLWVHR